ncbi:MAG: tail fiber domain-containing protein [Bacteroidia bacterium]|nr:tail fiber domain-containing protein [Bacteroidia bacterium]
MKHLCIRKSKFLSVFLFLSVVSFQVKAQFIGVGTATPQAKLDVSGNIAWRSWNIALVNGANGVLSPANEYSYYRITGPTAAFSIAGFSNPQDGKLVTLYNGTTQVMTVVDEDAGAAASGIQSGSGNLTINPWGSITLQYHPNAGTAGLWVVVNSYGELSPSSWNILGNAGTSAATNFLGTTDNVDLAIRTNNTEKARMNTNGQLGIGTAAVGGVWSGFTGLEIVGNQYTDIHQRAFGTFPVLYMSSTNGTTAAPTTTVQDDLLGLIGFAGYSGTVFADAAYIVAEADSSFNGNNLPARMSFFTRPSTSAAPLERMRITKDGLVGVGISAPTERLHVYHSGDISKNVVFAQAIQPTPNLDFQNNAVVGVARGANFAWGYSTGVMGVANTSSSFYGTGVHAVIQNNNNIPIAPSSDQALYVNANSLGYAALFMNGLIGVNTSNPLSRLHIVDNSTSAVIINSPNESDISYTTNTGSNSWQTGANNLGNGTSNNQFYIRNISDNQYLLGVQRGGNVGIGSLVATIPAATLDVASTGTGTVLVYRGRNNAADGTETQIGSIEKFHDYLSTIDFNNSAATVGLAINFGTSAAYDLQMLNNSAAKPTSGSWTIASDKRLKEDVHPFKDGLNVLKQINPVYFRYNGKAKTPNEYGIGVLAQDVKPVAPYMVGSFEFIADSKDLANKEEYLSYNPDALHYITLNAVKELADVQEKMTANLTTVTDFGTATLQQSEVFISYNSDFTAKIQGNTIPVATVTPLGSNPVTVNIIEQNATGFKVKIQNFDGTPVMLNWIAAAKVNAEVLSADKVYTEEERAELTQKVKLTKGYIRVDRENEEMEIRKVEQEARIKKEMEATRLEEQEALEAKAREEAKAAAKQKVLSPETQTPSSQVQPLQGGRPLLNK